jgi:hypothetical protein
MLISPMASRSRTLSRRGLSKSLLVTTKTSRSLSRVASPRTYEPNKMIFLGLATWIKRCTTAWTFSGVICQGGSVVVLIENYLASIIASNIPIRKTCHFQRSRSVADGEAPVLSFAFWVLRGCLVRNIPRASAREDLSSNWRSAGLVVAEKSFKNQGRLKTKNSNSVEMALTSVMWFPPVLGRRSRARRPCHVGSFANRLGEAPVPLRAVVLQSSSSSCEARVLSFGFCVLRGLSGQEAPKTLVTFSDLGENLFFPSALNLCRTTPRRTASRRARR